jgi:cytochrome b involved in lipid metabolism
MGNTLLKDLSSNTLLKDSSSNYTNADVAVHNTSSDCWIILDGYVYDVTAFIEHHPGGDLVFIKKAGQDVSKDFAAVGHSSSHKRALKQYMIGHCRSQVAAK